MLSESENFKYLPSEQTQTVENHAQLELVKNWTSQQKNCKYSGMKAIMLLGFVPMKTIYQTVSLCDLIGGPCQRKSEQGVAILIQNLGGQQLNCMVEQIKLTLWWLVPIINVWCVQSVCWVKHLGLVLRSDTSDIDLLSSPERSIVGSLLHLIWAAHQNRTLSTELWLFDIPSTFLGLHFPLNVLLRHMCTQINSHIPYRNSSQRSFFVSRALLTALTNTNMECGLLWSCCSKVKSPFYS